MDVLYKNVADQVKEIQLKLGYAREIVRLFYQLTSLNNLLKTDFSTAKEMLQYLGKYYENVNEANKEDVSINDNFKDLRFIVSGERLEVVVPAELSEYIHSNIEDSPFLKELINLFITKHNASIEEICDLFRKYDDNFVCKSYDEGDDFDYVVYFNDSTIDEYYYCIKVEIGHTIYHRFTKADYEQL